MLPPVKERPADRVVLMPPRNDGRDGATPAPPARRIDGGVKAVLPVHRGAAE